MKANDSTSWTTTHRAAVIQKVSATLKKALHEMEMDPENDQNLKETAERIAKMWVGELFIGRTTEPPKFTTFSNTENVHNMVVLKNARLVSMCSHHFMPFVGRIHIGYIPAEKICGISKLARVARWFARRPQIQEELTEQIKAYLQERLKPHGVIVVIEATHHCMTSRGVEEFESVMTTSAVTGSFQQLSTRDEFFSLIRR